MSTSGPSRGSTATMIANLAIGKFRLTEAKLKALFGNRNQSLFDQLSRWLTDLDDPALLGTLAAIGGESGKSPGMSLADAGIAKQFSEYDSGLKSLVKLAALSLATHIFNLLTGAADGLDAEVTKRLDLRRRLEAFGSGGTLDEAALDALLKGGVDAALVASVLEEMREDAVFSTKTDPGEARGDAALRTAATS